MEYGLKLVPMLSTKVKKNVCVRGEREKKKEKQRGQFRHRWMKQFNEIERMEEKREGRKGTNIF